VNEIIGKQFEIEFKVRVMIGRHPALILVFLLLVIVSITSCTREPSPSGPDQSRINVFVSILPQKYFVERVGGDRVSVSVLVKPGHSPATYEPTSKQMLAMSEADMYIRVGVPFEQNWLKRIRKTNLRMKILNGSQGITRRKMETGLAESVNEDEKRRHRHALRDPHVWLSPKNVKIMSKNIYKALSNVEPASEPYFLKNLHNFEQDLDNTDKRIREMFQDVSRRTFLVYHPSWGYFAEEYGLQQLPIEIGGKEASTRELVQVIETAKQEGIKAIIVQEQFSKKQAESIAREIQGEVIALDPLAEDYEKNLLHVAKTLSRIMR
jgi:zinc transport system substrate-binding protein